MYAELHELSSKDRVRAETTCQIRRDSSAGYHLQVFPRIFRRHARSGLHLAHSSTIPPPRPRSSRDQRPIPRRGVTDLAAETREATFCPVQAPTLPVSCPQEQGDRRRIRFFEPAFVACPSDIFSLASRGYQGVRSAAGNQAFPALPTGWYR